MREANVAATLKCCRPNLCRLLPLANAVSRYKGGHRRGLMIDIVKKSREPARYIISSLCHLGVFTPGACQVGFLLFALPFASTMRWITAEICFPALVFKINLSLIQWTTE